MEMNEDTSTSRTKKQEIEAARENPAELERLYRNAQSAGSEAAFEHSLRLCKRAHPDALLLEAWALRLDVSDRSQTHTQGLDRNWWIVLGISVLLGIVSALLAQGAPPIPFAVHEADILFRAGWGPLVAVGLLSYLTWARRSKSHTVRYTAAAVGVVAAGIYVGTTTGRVSTGGASEDAAVLASIHLLFVSWAAVGAAVCLGYSNPERQSFAYLVKSIESVLTGGIFFGSGLIFVGLTAGIFSVLGITISQKALVVAAAWGIGAIPLLAVASVYDPDAPPAAQDGQTGLTGTLRIVARLLLPLALVVLLVYLLWFIPAHFWKPFEEREVLLVYNVSILAIMVLLTLLVSGPIGTDSFTGNALFRYAVLGLGVLALILNVYALAAVAVRTADSGLTPNRFAVIGWNVTTLVILASAGIRIWANRRAPWASVLRDSIGLLAPLAAVWGILLLLTLPFFIG
jgi:hypothetical protein